MNKLILNAKELRDFLNMVDEVNPLKPIETDVINQEGHNPVFIYDWENRQIIVTDESED